MMSLRKGANSVAAYGLVPSLALGGPFQSFLAQMELETSDLTL